MEILFAVIFVSIAIAALAGNNSNLAYKKRRIERKAKNIGYDFKFDD